MPMHCGQCCDHGSLRTATTAHRLASPHQPWLQPAASSPATPSHAQPAHLHGLHLLAHVAAGAVVHEYCGAGVQHEGVVVLERRLLSGGQRLQVGTNQSAGAQQEGRLAGHRPARRRCGKAMRSTAPGAPTRREACWPCSLTLSATSVMRTESLLRGRWRAGEAAARGLPIGLRAQAALQHGLLRSCERCAPREPPTWWR